MRTHFFHGKYSITTLFLYTAILSLTTVSILFAEPLADGAGKFLGNITARRVDPAESGFAELWNQVTPENEGKWGVVERSRNSMDWDGLETSYQFAKKNNMLFKHHTLIWGNQEPYWIRNLSKEEQLAEVKEWIRLVAERYPDADFVDVVNEPSSHPASYREALGGSGTTGWDWIIWSFKEARTHFPNATLLMNEYNIINSVELTDGFFDLINLLKAHDCIDGMGLQSHYFSYPKTTPEIVKRNLDKLASTGVPLYCTEFDVTGNDSVQLAGYKDFFPLFWEHPAVVGVTLWGWMENHTWEPNTYLISESGVERPALTWLREYIASHKDVTRTTQTQITPLPASSIEVLSIGHAVKMKFQSSGIYTVRLSDLSGRVLTSLPAHYYNNEASVLLPQQSVPGVYVLTVADHSGTIVHSCPVVPNNR